MPDAYDRIAQMQLAYLIIDQKKNLLELQAWHLQYAKNASMTII